MNNSYVVGKCVFEHFRKVRSHVPKPLRHVRKAQCAVQNVFSCSGSIMPY